MDGTIGEIRLFAGNFAPHNWAFCHGQAAHISELQALYAIIGTIYGGDGRVTFGLPDLRGRTAIGAGNGYGTTPRPLGAKMGTQTETLHETQLPQHTHQAALTPPNYSGTVKLKALNGKGRQTGDPTGAYMADAPAGLEIYASQPNTQMGPSPVTITMDQNNPGSVNINPTGGSASHDNMQPSTGMHYIICTTGLFPSRN